VSLEIFEMGFGGGDIKITTLVNFHLYFISSISSMDECFMLKKGDKLDVGETLVKGHILVYLRNLE
jgi:hypothetical protein